MGTQAKITIVADTNVLISAFLWQGEIAKILDLAEDGKIRFVLSCNILDEFLRVLYYPHINRQVLKRQLIVNEIVSSLLEVAEVYPDLQRFNLITTDLSDNIILNCAFSSQADYIVSGDKHLLNLKEFYGIPILTPRQFLNLFK